MSIKKHIPNTVTCMNLVCGVLGIVFTFSGRFDWALYFMLGGAFFDFCDGLVARALHVSSAIGKELDSLSDAVTFGLLPALTMFRYMVSVRGTDLWCWIPLVLAVFSVLRLAKFNVDERQSSDFIGLATPASALLCVSLVHFVYLSPGSFLAVWAAGRFFLPIIAVVLSALMVSEIPMFSFKFKKGLDRPLLIVKVGFAGLVFLSLIVAFALRLNFSIIIVLAVAVYILINIFYSLFHSTK